MRYGLPYKGSKNAIAEWIVDNLPRAEVFVDLFCGGGAVTHRAMLTGKYDRFIMNDIDGRLPKLFKECAFGKHTLEKREFIRQNKTSVPKKKKNKKRKKPSWIQRKDGGADNAKR